MVIVLGNYVVIIVFVDCIYNVLCFLRVIGTEMVWYVVLKIVALKVKKIY